MTDRPSLRPETLAARADGSPCERTGAVIPPIHPSATYARNDTDYAQIGGRGCSRDDNQGYLQAEGLLAELEGGTGCSPSA